MTLAPMEAPVTKPFLGNRDFWFDSGKAFAKSLGSFAIEFMEQPVSKCTLTNFPTFKVDLLFGSVCLSKEKMTPFANTLDMFFSFDIVEYRALFLSMSTRFSCPAACILWLLLLRKLE